MLIVNTICFRGGMGSIQSGKHIFCGIYSIGADYEVVMKL